MQTNTQQQRFPLPDPFAILPSYPSQPPGMWFPMQNFMHQIPSNPYPGTSWALCTGLQVPAPGYVHTIETGPWNQISNPAFSHGLYPISNMMGPTLLQGSYPVSNNMIPILVQQPCPSFNNMGPYIPVQPALGSTDAYYPQPCVIGANEEQVVAQLNYVSIDSFNSPMDPHGPSMTMNSSNPEATIEATGLETAGGDPETAIVSELSRLENFEDKLSLSIPSEDKEMEQPGSQGTAMEHEIGQENQAEQDGHSEAKSQPRNIFCTLCKANKESKLIYTSHILRDDSGIVQCPILRAFVCPNCNATGDNAHTRRHCPRIKESFQNPVLYSKKTNSTGDQVLIRYL